MIGRAAGLALVLVLMTPRHVPAQSAEPLPAFIPPLTDADREAAFPDVHGHPAHDTSVNYFVLFDQLEWQGGRGLDAFSWDTKGWVGQDRHRLWFRSEGDRVGSRIDQAQTHLLYGRAVARWWDVMAGVRVDTLPDTPRTALALGIQGLARTGSRSKHRRMSSPPAVPTCASRRITTC